MNYAKLLAVASCPRVVRALLIAPMLAIAVWLFAASTVHAATIPVSASCTITQAITAANTDSAVGGCNAGNGADTVELQPLVYELNVADNSIGGHGNNGLPPITSTVTIRGNGASIARALAFPCPGDSDPDFRLLYVDETGRLVLEDVTLRNGCTGGYGGAIYNYRGNVYVKDSVFDANSATFGGALNNDNGHVRLQNTVAHTNTAVSGGALFNVGDSAHITITMQSEVYANFATSGGGGIYNWDGSVTVMDSAFHANRADSYGGGLYFTGGTATIHDSAVYSNTAGESAGGGGLFSQAASITISNTTIYSNSSLGNGGGMYTQSSSVMTVTDGSKIYANQAGSGGGGVYVFRSVLLVQESAVYTNSAAGRGGGLLGNLATVTLSDSAVYSNSADSGGGIANYSEGSAMTITNQSGIYANTAQNGGGIEIYDANMNVLGGSAIYSNTASGSGGGIMNVLGNLYVQDSSIFSNTALFGGGLDNSKAVINVQESAIYANLAEIGGGVYNIDSGLTVQGSRFYSNTAKFYGGGFYNSGVSAAMTITGQSEIYANNAASYGGGFYLDDGTLNMQDSRVILNQAAGGGALVQINGSTSITTSCIVNNSDEAIAYIGGTSPIEATQNWWGVASGPAGAGPGSGDTVSSDVDFSSFATAPILDCPTIPPSLIYIPLASND